MNATQTQAPNEATDDAALLIELRAINERLARIEGTVEQATHRIEGLEELREDLWPMVEGASHAVSRKLHELDQAGAIGFARESMNVAERIATSFNEEDVRLLGENVVSILKTVRNLTQPEVLELADRTAGALRTAEVQPTKKVGLFKAMRDPEIRRGMAVMMTVLRELGSDPENGDQAAASVVAADEMNETAVATTA